MRIVQVEPIGIKKENQEKLKKEFAANGHEIVFFSEKPETEEEITQRATHADVIVVSNLPLNKKILSACNKLKMISVAFAGVDHIDMDYCRKNQIMVCNAADYSIHSVAELAMGLIISLMRKFRWAENQLINEKDREGFLGTELFGKTIGIIGLGRIGQKVAEFGKAFGCEVLAYNRTHKNIPGVEIVSLERLLEESDIVTVHVPLTKETRHLLGEEEIARMKSTSILINTARGPVVDYNALAQALNEEKIAGAGIDVYEKEPPIEKSHPLINSKNTILLPHIGFATKEAIDKRSDIVIDNIYSWLKGNPRNVIS
jgi:D-3-phosphoglycerate dehydrogenase